VAGDFLSRSERDKSEEEIGSQRERGEMKTKIKWRHAFLGFFFKKKRYFILLKGWLTEFNFGPDLA
jgi:hypothetical protein